MTEEEIRKQIGLLMDVDRFIEIEIRLTELRKDEDGKLAALAELQKAYLSATTDEEQEMVKQTVGRIRELSRTTRLEIRALNQEIVQHMTLEKAKQLYEMLLQAKSSS